MKGKVAILAKADGKLDPAKIFKATYDSGVTVAEMTITATGTIERDAAQQLLFRVDGDQAFPLKLDARARELEALAGTARTVELRGRLYAKPAKGGKQKPEVQPMETLEILRK